MNYNHKLNREQISRDIIFANSGLFLDVGGGDGELRYLLGINKGKFSKRRYNKNRIMFDRLYEYHVTDLENDICSPDFKAERQYDVIYSNNVFEHLYQPFQAIKNIYDMMKPGGIAVIIAPFAWRYHEVPGDYFRYSHTAFPMMFNRAGDVEVLVSGYDTSQRRHYNQGSGRFNDRVPGLFGWRESWQAITVVRKKMKSNT
jgi:SAM-dependent methyltransferase